MASRAQRAVGERRPSGRVSVEGASCDYGVSLQVSRSEPQASEDHRDGSLADLDLAIDWAETERLRKERLAPS